MSNVPAGWYPDPEEPERRRYWDGARWTHAMTPGPASVSPPPLEPPGRGAALAVVGEPTGARRARLSSNLVIGGVVAIAVLALGVGVAVVSGMARPDVASPAGAPATATAAPAPAPAPAPSGDAAAFRDDAAKQLDDMAKDLDDIVTTVAQHGFFRLYSNSIELAFNLAQLRSIAAPASVSGTWPAALDAIDASLGGLDDAIGTADGDTILAAVDAVRARVDAARDVARSAQ